MRFQILAVAFISTLACRAQDWQVHYSAALQSYQHQDYETALTEARQAITLATKDLKGQAFSRQIFTSACLETQRYDQGLPEVVLEIENFKRLEPDGENYREAVHKQGQLQMGLGKFEDAARSFHQLQLLHAALSDKSYAYFVSVAEEADALMQAKKYAEAQVAYESSIAGFRNLPDAGEDYLYALFNSAYIDFNASRHSAASEKLVTLIAFLERNNLKSYPEYEQARQMLSRLNVAQGTSEGLVLPADRAQQLFAQAFALQEKDGREALRRYQACAEIIAANNLLSNTSFSCYINYARLLYAMGSFTQSAEMLTRARQQAASLYAENSAENGHVQVLAADLALHDGKVEEASLLYLSGIKNIRGERPDVWTKQIRWVSEQLIGARAAGEAIPMLAFVLSDPAYAALATREKIVVHQLNGRAHIDSRQTAQLIAYLEPLADKEKDADLRQACLLMLAQAANEQGNLQLAHQRLREALAIAPGGIVAGEVYFESARAYQREGDYKEAEIHYRKALEHIVRAPFAETVMPQLFNSLATFYIQLGNYGAAEDFFRNLLSHDNGTAGFYNAVRQNLAALYQQTGRYNEAKSLLLKTLQVDALQGTDHPDYAVALQNLAAVYQQLHQLDSAQLLYEQALAIDGKQYGEQSLSFATKLANLGTVYQEAQDFASARRMFERALAIRGKLLSAGHPDYAYSQYTLANLLYRTQKPREALPLFNAAANFYIDQIHDVFPALSDHERTAFYNRVAEVIASYENFVLENIYLQKDLPATLLNFRLQTKALLLNSSLKVRNQILQSGNANLIRDFHVWRHTKDQLAYLFSLPKAEREAHAALVEEYSHQADALEKSLSLQSEHFAETFVADTTGWLAVRDALAPGEGAIEILRVKLKDRDSVLYAALIVKPGQEMPAVVVMPDGNFLEQKAFNGYINRIRYRIADEVSYNIFWKKVAPLVADLHTLYLSPDGVYTKINCATLYDPAAKEYLIDRHKVMLVSNLRDVVSKGVGKDVAAHAVLVGFPDYRMHSAKALGDFQSARENSTLFARVFSESFAPLPGTEKEVQQVAQLLQSRNWQVETHLRGEALEEKIKEGDQVTLLHIATHGFFVAPKDEHAKQVYSNDLRDIENNVMLRSGLLLAGAEKNLVEMLLGQPKGAVEDGILTAYEVMNLNLDDADLVVLSACETGTGDVKNGEGVYGLQRAFLLAGAKHVVMSLWKVDDAATQELMAAFYAEWLNGKDKLTAFQDAQIKMKEKYPHPNHWGAFVMMGK